MVKPTEKKLEKAVVEVIDGSIVVSDFVPLDDDDDDDESKEKFNPYHDEIGRFTTSGGATRTQQELPLLEDVEKKPPEFPKFRERIMFADSLYEDDVESSEIFGLYRATRAEILGISEDDYEDELTEHLKEQVKNADIAIRVDPLILDVILDDGRFKSQHESLQSRGYFGPKVREDVENAVWGEETYERIEHRPIYGYLTKAESLGPSASKQYGSVEIILKRDSVEDRTTFTVGDSLGAIEGRRVIPAPITFPDHSAVAGNISTNPYLPSSTSGGALRATLGSPKTFLYYEAQIHGGVSLDDIQFVKFTERTLHSSTISELIDRLDSLGIAHNG